MFVKRWLSAIFACGCLLACGGGGSPAPAPVVTQDPLPDPQNPEAESQSPKPDPQTPRVGAEEPLPNAQDPLPLNGEGGAPPGDP